MSDLVVLEKIKHSYHGYTIIYKDGLHASHDQDVNRLNMYIIALIISQVFITLYNSSNTENSKH